MRIAAGFDCLVVHLSLRNAGSIGILGDWRLSDEEANEEPVRGVLSRRTPHERLGVICVDPRLIQRRRALRVSRTRRVRLRGEPASWPGREDHVRRREAKPSGDALLRL